MAAVSEEEEEEAAAVCSCEYAPSTSLVMAQSQLGQQICINCGPIAAQPLQQVPAAMDSGLPFEAAPSTSLALAPSQMGQQMCSSNYPIAAQPLQQVPAADSADQEKVWFSSKRKRSPPGKSGSGTDPEAAGDVPVSMDSATPKRARGRPPRSTKKKKEVEALGSDIVPYIINVEVGQDVFLVVRAFAKNLPRGICILSAHGGISDVTLREAPNIARTLPGPHDIVSLSGSFMPPGVRGSRNGEICIAVVNSDGRILGGRVAGPLIAVSRVQVILGGFVADGRKKAPSESSSSAAPKPPSPSQGTL